MFLPPTFNIILEFLGSVIRKEKELDIQIEKKNVELLLFTFNMIVFEEDFKECTKQSYGRYKITI